MRPYRRLDNVLLCCLLPAGLLLCLLFIPLRASGQTGKPDTTSAPHMAAPRTVARDSNASDEPSSNVSDKFVDVGVREQHHCGLRFGVSCTPDRNHRSNYPNTADAARTTDGRRLCSCRNIVASISISQAQIRQVHYHEGVTR